MFFTVAFSQGDAKSIETLYDTYQQNSIQEKIFVHTDKNFYIAGEIAWFKLYYVNAATNKPLSLSKVAYVEIIDSTNKSIVKAKIALKNGVGNGSLYLPLSLNSGNYKLRAYTNWMKNFGADYFFEKNITIINVQKKLDLSEIHPSKNFDIQFFPEGGNLVNNIPGKVAFIASDSHGKGINFTGYLVDNKDTVLMFYPQHNGMGSFSFTPLANHNYKAFVTSDSGESLSKVLPMVYNSGYVMSVVDTLDKLNVLVRSDIPDQQEVYLFIHTRGIKKAFLETAFKKGMAVFDIDKNILGDGISTLTIFNTQRQPVCERLWFKKPEKTLQLDIKTSQTVYPTRSNVNVEIAVGKNDMENDSASLSMAVYRNDSLQADEASINSYLLLTSDINGYIDDPDYYFKNNDVATNKALDNLMLIYGWRRFKWEDILNNAKPFFEFVPEYNGPIITGTVINKLTGKPAAGIETYMSIPGFPKGFSSSLSDSIGGVKFELGNYYGSSQVIFQANQGNDSIYSINFTDPFSKTFSAKPFPLFTIPKNGAAYFLQQSVSMQVQTIFSGKELRHFDNPGIDTTTFFTNVDAKYLLDDYTRFTTLEEVLREYVEFADVKKRQGKFHLNLFDFPNGEMFKTDPLILLDGVPVLDVDKFMQIDPLKLYRLEVINRRYFLGNSVFRGILNWTSYKKNMADYEPSPATIIDYEGLQIEREFYSPVYANEEQRLSHIPDFRNVLLWSPNIKIAPGKAREINFYTSDVPGTYTVVVQGITKNGLCGKNIFSFEVKKKTTP